MWGLSFKSVQVMSAPIFKSRESEQMTVATFHYSRGQSTSRAGGVMNSVAAPHWITEHCPAPVIFPHPQETHVTATAMLLQLPYVALEAFHTCVYLCVCVCVHMHLWVCVGACLHVFSPARKANPVCPKYTSKKFRFKLGVCLDLNHSDENRTKMSRMCRQYLLLDTD